MFISREATVQWVVAVLVAFAIVFIWRWLLPYSHSYRHATNKRHGWHEVLRNGRRQWVRRWQIRDSDHLTGLKTPSRVYERARLQALQAASASNSDWGAQQKSEPMVAPSPEPTQNPAAEPEPRLRAVND